MRKHPEVTTRVVEAPISATRSPPTAGPTIRAVDRPACIDPFAAAYCVGGTS
nr:hypothetical protein [Microbacterium karelineae]